MRGSMIETMNSNFIRTARAKGCRCVTSSSSTRCVRPCCRWSPTWDRPSWASSPAPWIETIFGLPGIGQLFVNGALNRDYSMVLGLTILVGALTITFNAVVDILYAVIDPKIRY
jgi:oligopeptide transport system permease protein